MGTKLPDFRTASDGTPMHRHDGRPSYRLFHPVARRHVENGQDVTEQVHMDAGLDSNGNPASGSKSDVSTTPSDTKEKKPDQGGSPAPGQGVGTALLSGLGAGQKNFIDRLGSFVTGITEQALGGGLTAGGRAILDAMGALESCGTRLMSVGEKYGIPPTADRVKVEKTFRGRMMAQEQDAMCRGMDRATDNIQALYGEGIDLRTVGRDEIFGIYDGLLKHRDEAVDGLSKASSWDERKSYEEEIRVYNDHMKALGGRAKDLEHEVARERRIRGAEWSTSRARTKAMKARQGEMMDTHKRDVREQAKADREKEKKESADRRAEERRSVSEARAKLARRNRNRKRKADAKVRSMKQGQKNVEKNLREGAKAHQKAVERKERAKAEAVKKKEAEEDAAYAEGAHGGHGTVADRVFAPKYDEKYHNRVDPDGLPKGWRSGYSGTMKALLPEIDRARGRIEAGEELGPEERRDYDAARNVRQLMNFSNKVSKTVKALEADGSDEARRIGEELTASYRAAAPHLGFRGYSVGKDPGSGRRTYTRNEVPSHEEAMAHPDMKGFLDRLGKADSYLHPDADGDDLGPSAVSGQAEKPDAGGPGPDAPVTDMAGTKVYGITQEEIDRRRAMLAGNTGEGQGEKPGEGSEKPVPQGRKPRKRKVAMKPM